jgi:prevent-host-death family protein
MKCVNTHEAKTQLSRLLKRVAAGEQIAIANRGIPIAKLVPVAGAEKRKLGAFTGLITMKEDFDAPLAEDILAAFEGKRKRVKKKG